MSWQVPVDIDSLIKYDDTLIPALSGVLIGRDRELEHPGIHAHLVLTRSPALMYD